MDIVQSYWLGICLLAIAAAILVVGYMICVNIKWLRDDVNKLRRRNGNGKSN